MKKGAQTYAWQMSFEHYSGKIPHMLDICQKAGFSGLEVELSMLGKYIDQPCELYQEFISKGIRLAAFGVPISWGVLGEKDILKIVEDSFKVAEPFGETLLSFSIMPPSVPWKDKGEEQKKFLKFLRSVAETTVKKGYKASFHTNSSRFSLFWTKEDYKILKQFFEETGMGFTPDTGHIVRGGMVPVEIFREFMPHIVHVHFKDADKEGKWALMGEGCIAFGELLDVLRHGGFKGYILAEEESEEAVKDPDDAMLRDGDYLKSIWRGGKQ